MTNVKWITNEDLDIMWARVDVAQPEELGAHGLIRSIDVLETLQKVQRIYEASGGWPDRDLEHDVKTLIARLMQE